MLRFVPVSSAVWRSVRSAEKQRTISRRLASEMRERNEYLFYLPFHNVVTKKLLSQARPNIINCHLVYPRPRRGLEARMVSITPKSPRERSARALCELHGHPPGIRMDGAPCGCRVWRRPATPRRRKAELSPASADRRHHRPYSNAICSARPTATKSAARQDCLNLRRFA